MTNAELAAMLREALDAWEAVHHTPCPTDAIGIFYALRRRQSADADFSALGAAFAPYIIAALEKDAGE